MIDKSYNFQLSEKFIIKNFLKKLNLNTTGTFNFENDAAYLNTSAKNKTIVTTDTIVENIDFFLTKIVFCYTSAPLVNLLFSLIVL